MGSEMCIRDRCGRSVFYKLVMCNDARWHLAIARQFPSGRDVDVWAYSRCEPVSDPESVPFDVDVEAEPVDFSPTAFGATVVSERFADAVHALAPNDIQRIPATVDSPQTWQILNVLPSTNCIDHSSSVIQYYPDDPAECGSSPEKAGQPRGVVKLVISPELVGEHHIFRPAQWQVATIVSEQIKNALTDLRATGVEFWPVTV